MYPASKDYGLLGRACAERSSFTYGLTNIGVCQGAQLLRYPQSSSYLTYRYSYLAYIESKEEMSIIANSDHFGFVTTF